eukprot:gene5814-11725_t
MRNKLVKILNDSISTAVVSTSPVKKTVIITGANRGIGFNACKQLASTNEWSIIMACRSKSDAQKAVSSIPISKGRENVEIMQLDLADFNSIKTFSDQIIKSNRPINVLACNAGIQLSSNPTGKDSRPVKRTANGFEATVGTNHIGHFYLTQLLLKTLGKQKGSRVAFVGSGVHNPEEAGGDVGSKATLGDMSGLVAGFKDDISMVDGSSYDADKAYKDSKLCNVITALELARRLKSQRSDITSNVMNPGLIPTTGLFRELNPIFVTIFTFLTRYVFKVAVSEEEGGRRLAFMISSPSLNGLSGLYYTGKAGKSEFVPYEPSKEAQDQKKAKLFWEYSMKLIPRL